MVYNLPTGRSSCVNIKLLQVVLHDGKKWQNITQKLRTSRNVVIKSGKFLLCNLIKTQNNSQCKYFFHYSAITNNMVTLMVLFVCIASLESVFWNKQNQSFYTIQLTIQNLSVNGRGFNISYKSIERYETLILILILLINALMSSNVFIFSVNNLTPKLKPGLLVKLTLEKLSGKEFQYQLQLCDTT